MAASFPPRTLNVQKFAESRAPELESLHAIVSARTGGDFRLQRSKRRRTTSHDSRIATGGGRRWKRRRPANLRSGGGGEAGDAAGADEEEASKRKLSRRARRRAEFREKAETGFGVSGDGTRRLRTHVWHAKRFAMVKRWGFYLPLGLHGRGRGSRAILKWLKSGAFVHDASYCCPVQLEGPEDSLQSVLRMVLVPSPSNVSEDMSKSVLHGVCHQSAMLHHVGAPASPLIAPVTYIWRPVSRDHIDLNVDMDHLPNECEHFGKSEYSTSYRQLWVWVHAAAFNEGFDALRFACQKQMNDSGVSVSCFSLEGQLGKLEVLGSKANEILQKILHPVTESCNSFEDSTLKKCSYMKACTGSKVKKSFALERAEHLPFCAILSLTVLDPRDLASNKEVDPVSEASSTGPNGDLLKEISKESSPLESETPKTNVDELLSLWSKPEENAMFLSDCNELWGSHDRLNPPIEESALCSERHQRRLKYFCLDRMNSGTQIAENKGGHLRPCSMLLFKNSDERSPCSGWSIILPLNWVKAFWIPLISSGAHAIGLRERRWVACDTGIPSFPCDFPDSKAYLSFMAAEASESDQMAELCPLAVRPLRVPIPPPWDCIRSNAEKREKGPNIMGDSQMVDLQPHGGELSPTSFGVDSGPENCGLASTIQAGLFQGFVARTSHVLSSYLNRIHGSHLLLFPNTIMGKRAFSELMERDRICWVPKNINHMASDREQCFLRVLLHAYKEGVFEEGAVICSPTSDDLILWTSRAEEQEKLQIPQSSVKSYFTQQGSGRWELRLPVDSLTRQSYRWPIGFVTTGFVRGSAKPVAEALCEVTQLAQLREQQWSEMQGKGRPKIFVLVRNLRSAAFRLALATIVLEQQEDTEFM